MGLIDYIKGKRYGKDANQLERESMEDAFLQEALDGYDAVLSNHIDSIERLQQEITQQSKVKKQHRLVFYWSVAAGVALMLGVGSIFIFSPSDKELIAKNTEEVQEEGLETSDKFDDNIIYDSVAVVDNKQGIVEEKALKNADKEVEAPPSISIAEMRIVENDVSADDIAKGELAADKAEQIKEEKTKKAVADTRASNERLAEVAKSGKTLSKSIAMESLSAVSGAAFEPQKASAPTKEFDKVEFKSYFLSKAKKSEAENSVEVEFVLSDAQRPSSINIKNASSEEAKKEALRVISSSPQWTEIAGRKIKLKLKW